MQRDSGNYWPKSCLTIKAAVPSCEKWGPNSRFNDHTGYWAKIAHLMVKKHQFAACYLFNINTLVMA